MYSGDMAIYVCTLVNESHLIIKLQALSIIYFLWGHLFKDVFPKIYVFEFNTFHVFVCHRRRKVAKLFAPDFRQYNDTVDEI